MYSYLTPTHLALSLALYLAFGQVFGLHQLAAAAARSSGVDDAARQQQPSSVAGPETVVASVLQRLCGNYR